MNYSVLILQPWLNYRGAETLSYQLAEDLSAKGIKARILSLYVSDYVHNWVQYRYVLLPNVLTQRLMKNQIFFFFFGFFILIYLIFRHGRSYTVFNPHNFPTVWVSVIAAHFLRKKVVWTVHNFPQHPFRGLIGMLFEFLTDPIDRFFIKHVDRIVAVSEKVAEQVRTRYHVDVEIVYPGIDIDFWRNSRAHYRYQEQFVEKRIMLHAAQIRPEKNQEFTYDVFRQLAPNFDDLILVFAGEIYEQFLEYQNKLRSDILLRDRVFFTGTLSKAQLATLYSQSTIVIHSSVWGEGCALVPLEAVAAGALNIVVPRGCGSDEIIEREQGGVVYDLDDGVRPLALQLTEMLEGHLSDIDQDFILRYSRERFATNYDRVFQKFSLL